MVCKKNQKSNISKTLAKARRNALISSGLYDRRTKTRIADKTLKQNDLRKKEKAKLRNQKEYYND